MLKAERSSKNGNGGLLILIIYLFTYLFIFAETSRNVAQTKFGTVKNHGHAYKFYLNHWLFDEAFKYSDGVNFEVMMGQRLNHSVQDYETL
jgi:hypothetical protein